jgi:hypothetical protein
LRPQERLGSTVKGTFGFLSSYCVKFKVSFVLPLLTVAFIFPRDIVGEDEEGKPSQVK